MIYEPDEGREPDKCPVCGAKYGADAMVLQAQIPRGGEAFGKRYTYIEKYTAACPKCETQFVVRKYV